MMRNDAHSALMKLHDLGLESVSRTATAHTFHEISREQDTCITADVTASDVSQGAITVKNAVSPVLAGNIDARIALPNPPTVE